MSLPDRVTLELTNKCNRDCRGCPRTKMDYEIGEMDFGLLEKIVDQLPSETCIIPFFRGESLFYDRFYDAMRLLRKFDEVQMATNGDFLSLDSINAMLKTCSFISYSLHDFRFPDDIAKAVAFLGNAKNEDIQTQISILETEMIESAKKEFIDRWLRYVDRVRIYVEHSHVGFGDVDPRYRSIEEELPCSKPSNDMVVYWDGKVVLCNHDWSNNDPLGDLKIHSVESVWNNSEYDRVRLLHRLGFRKQIETCKDCDYWMVEYLPNKMFGEMYTNE